MRGERYTGGFSDVEVVLGLKYDVNEGGFADATAMGVRYNDTEGDFFSDETFGNAEISPPHRPPTSAGIPAAPLRRKISDSQRMGEQDA